MKESRERRAVFMSSLLLAAACAAAGISAAEIESAPRRAKASAPRPLPAADPAYRSASEGAKADLIRKHGAAEKARIERGVAQVLDSWRSEDGPAREFGTFVTTEFIPRGPGLDALFDRLEFAFERIDGHNLSIARDLRWATDVESGPILPIDERLSGFEPSAHVQDDLFKNRVAFVVLLNFPRTTLQERLESGPRWSRRVWAEARLAGRFEARVPAEVTQRITTALVEADAYISGYNIYLHHLVDGAGPRLFPAGLRLITHWGLRDELKARYADPDGLARQRMIARVMERIVLQEIPQAVIDNPLLDWNPATNAVTPSTVKDAEAPPGRTAQPSSEREADVRYRKWLQVAQAERLADPYYQGRQGHLERRFNLDREIPEAEATALLTSILESPAGRDVARIIAARLRRPLEPFDVWYAGFKPRARYSEAELDALTRRRFPTAAAYAEAIPSLLKGLGFTSSQARFLASHIEVDPSRGAGHAMGAERRDDKAHLRTRVGREGMDYKGYNIAVHEMGHNVEQVFSLNRIDHWLLHGVPNTAFTEALAFVFQSRDLRLLGLHDDPEADSLRALEEFWGTREIAGVGLVDIMAWRFLQDHPRATPAQLRDAVVGAARQVWNRYYADLLGGRDVVLLAIYSHMVDGALYTPDYGLGHLIAFQLEQHFRKQARLGEEFERVSRIGRVTPDLWMRTAVGGPLSVEPLLQAAKQATERLRPPADAPGEASGF
ncbi:MAG TPA: hypothetical protein VFB95_02655 [Candidatus Cryosericum sp.]|nr:hypothetical protein [Candidatus Cryosericum sp.]